MVKAPSLEAKTHLQWSQTDQWLLTAGAVLLVSSFAIKCIVVLNSH